MVSRLHSPLRTGRIPLHLVAGLIIVLVGSAIFVWLFPLPASRSTTSLSETSAQRGWLPGKSLPDFELKDQTGKMISLDDLKGKVWIAGFVYSRCHSTCPIVSATMAALRDRLPADVELVSFSVDPRHDTPEVLSQYAALYKADAERWHFLTGDEETIYRVLREGFQVGVEPNTDPRTISQDLVIHSNRIAVVDRDGVVRFNYDSQDSSPIERIADAVTRIQKRK